MASQSITVSGFLALTILLATVAIAVRNILAAVRRQPYSPVPQALETTIRTLTWLLCPFAVYELIVFFSRADLQSRIGVSVFVVAVALLTLIRRVAEKTRAVD